MRKKLKLPSARLWRRCIAANWFAIRFMIGGWVVILLGSGSLLLPVNIWWHIGYVITSLLVAYSMFTLSLKLGFKTWVGYKMTTNHLCRYPNKSMHRRIVNTADAFYCFGAGYKLALKDYSAAIIS